MPNGVIKTAQAAEWRVQGWKLGKPPSLPVEAVGYNHRAPVSSAEIPPVDVGDEESWDGADHLSQTSYGTVDKGGGATPRIHVVNSRSISPDLTSPPANDKSRLRRLFSRSSKISPGPSSRSPSLRPGSPVERPASMLSDSTSSAPRPSSTDEGVDLGTALLAASHAESLKGGTADLLTILDRKLGFNYNQVTHAVRVWHGDRDERISLSSVKKLEREMRECRVTAVAGAGHDLMSNADVMISVRLRFALARRLS